MNDFFLFNLNPRVVRARPNRLEQMDCGFQEWLIIDILAYGNVAK